MLSFPLRRFREKSRRPGGGSGFVPAEGARGREKARKEHILFGRHNGNSLGKCLLNALLGPRDCSGIRRKKKNRAIHSPASPPQKFCSAFTALLFLHRLRATRRQRQPLRETHTQRRRRHAHTEERRRWLGSQPFFLSH